MMMTKGREAAMTARGSAIALPTALSLYSESSFYNEASNIEGTNCILTKEQFT